MKPFLKLLLLCTLTFSASLFAYPGCDDPSANNFDGGATSNNGSCTYTVYGCMDSLALNYNFNANTDDGSCIMPVYGCTNSTASNYNSSANTDDGSCIMPVYGCTNSTASNYNSSANTDDGSCNYNIYGCTNNSASNYNSSANIDDGSCYIPYGCTDPTASNYNPNATPDPQSCTYLGCTSNTAINYSPQANQDDGSCVSTVYKCSGDLGDSQWYSNDSCTGSTYSPNSWSTGIIVGPVTSTGDFNPYGYSIGNLRVNSSGSLSIGGHLNLPLEAYFSGPVTIQSGGTLSTNGSYSFGDITVNGTFVSSATQTINGLFTVNGEVNYGGNNGAILGLNGNVAINSGGNVDAYWLYLGGSLVNINSGGTITVTGGMQLSSNPTVLNVNSGGILNLNGNGDSSHGANIGSTLNVYCGGNFYNSARFGNNGTFNYAHFNNTGIFTNNGTANDISNTCGGGDSTPPTITSVSSNKANGTYGVGEVIDIDVTFSEAVTSTGNVTVTLETGTTDRTCTFTVSNSTTGTCNYTVQSGDSSADLTVNSIAGTIRDQSNNAMSSYTIASNLAANKALVIDTVVPGSAPTITNVTSSKTNGTYGVGTAIDITLTFSEPVTGAGTILTNIGRKCYFFAINSTTATCTIKVVNGNKTSDLTIRRISTFTQAGGAYALKDADNTLMTNFVPTTNLGANKNIVINTVQTKLSVGKPKITTTTAIFTIKTSLPNTITVTDRDNTSVNNVSLSSIVEGKSAKVTITGLTSCTTYAFRFSATNTRISEPVVVKTKCS